MQRLDADAFDEVAGVWAAQATRPVPGQRRVIAVDGKTPRGSASGGKPGQHLLAALDHAHGAVLGQAEMGAKTNEIPMFPVLLDRVDITGAVITADAVHAQRSHATYPGRAQRATAAWAWRGCRIRPGCGWPQSERAEPAGQVVAVKALAEDLALLSAGVDVVAGLPVVGEAEPPGQGFEVEPA